jgi:hypothetical protein
LATAAAFPASAGRRSQAGRLLVLALIQQVSAEAHGREDVPGLGCLPGPPDGVVVRAVLLGQCAEVVRDRSELVRHDARGFIS